jgi:hypothetical protein
MGRTILSACFATFAGALSIAPEEISGLRKVSGDSSLTRLIDEVFITGQISLALSFHFGLQLRAVCKSV